MPREFSLNNVRELNLRIGNSWTTLALVCSIALWLERVPETLVWRGKGNRRGPPAIFLKVLRFLCWFSISLSFLYLYHSEIILRIINFCINLIYRLFTGKHKHASGSKLMEGVTRVKIWWSLKLTNAAWTWSFLFFTHLYLRIKFGKDQPCSLHFPKNYCENWHLFPFLISDNLINYENCLKYVWDDNVKKVMFIHIFN